MAKWTGFRFIPRNNDSLDRYNTEFLPPTNKVTVVPGEVRERPNRAVSKTAVRVIGP